MGDISQSRYSIVERLTQTKLEIISAKSQLDADITSKQQAVDEAEQELKDWESSIKSNIEEQRREKKRAIDKLEREAKNAVARKKIKADTFDNKIKAIDQALSQIQKISETSTPTSS